ncbi:hypothetical protein [Pseudomonas sp. NFR16]|uniref:phage tail assembly protein T n=1 Tax=Pseudomonas sp. NFR16 TaxID=1566248 RepID=UPI0008B8FEFA|nr:hypothetical protein [Pseudomonas sp. NFR16]SEJ49485.1 hypothetical protein SAMN03159495_3436 [Pseudomonas sp. NFR16]
MTYVESVNWMRYRRQTGPLNLGTRLDEGFAMLATVFNNAMGGKAKFSDFMPDRGFGTEQKKATPQDLLALLQSVKG